jgi:hypothetical protein
MPLVVKAFPPAGSDQSTAKTLRCQYRFIVMFYGCATRPSRKYEGWRT